MQSKETLHAAARAYAATLRLDVRRTPLTHRVAVGLFRQIAVKLSPREHYRAVLKGERLAVSREE